MEKPIEKLSWEQLREGDLVLCRKTTAPPNNANNPPTVELFLIRVLFISAVSIKIQVSNDTQVVTHSVLWKSKDDFTGIEFLDLIERAKEKEDGNAMKSATRHRLDALLKFVEECYLQANNTIEPKVGFQHFVNWEADVSNKLTSFMALIRDADDNWTDSIALVKRGEILIKSIVEGWVGLDRYFKK
jgi:hypothetical protein